MNLFIAMPAGSCVDDYEANKKNHVIYLKLQGPVFSAAITTTLLVYCNHVIYFYSFLIAPAN
jgi:hypothetical protein